MLCIKSSVPCMDCPNVLFLCEIFLFTTFILLIESLAWLILDWSRYRHRPCTNIAGFYVKFYNCSFFDSLRSSSNPTIYFSRFFSFRYYFLYMLIVNSLLRTSLYCTYLRCYIGLFIVRKAELSVLILLLMTILFIFFYILG